MDFSNKLILAPMAGVCDQPFRLLCKEQGCDILYTEMISAKGLYYDNKNTVPLLAIHKDEEPIGVQIFGSEPKLLGDMAKKIEDRGFSFIDVNMGCPVPKIVNNGEGSALMKNPLLIGEIVSCMVKSTKLPVTIKIRSGFDEEHINAPEIARIAEECGASAVAVHGRTRKQYYSGHADWEVIAKVKDSVNIPVIGNGDILTPQDVINMKKQTNCDAFMIGRGARGNPWIFREIKEYFRTGKIPARPDIQDIKNTMLRHAELMIEFKGEFTGIHEMRKHVAWYSVGLPDSARLRNLINQVESYEEMKELLDRWTDGNI
ncbi:MAG: tRNA dihydrouridine synthase DusB [Coprococcus sp.]